MNLKQFNLLLIAVGLASAMYLLFTDAETASAYSGIWILSLTFVGSSSLMHLGVRQRAGGFQLTYLFLNSLFFLRFVVTPLMIHFAGSDYTAFEYVSLTPGSLTEAIYLMAYEAIAASVFFCLAALHFGKKLTKNTRYTAHVTLSGSRILYCVFALFGTVLIAVWGIRSGAISFMSITGDTDLSERSALQLLTVQFMVIGGWLAFLLVASSSAQSYRIKPSLFPVIISVLSGILLVMLIFGDRRSVQLYTGVAVSATLIRCFPDKKKTILVAIFGAVTAVILSVTIWRLFDRQGISMDDVSMLSTFSVAGTASALQAYIGGPYQIAAANHLLINDGIGFENLIYDFLRSTFLINFFIDRSGLISSQIMNETIYQGQLQTGWLIFTTSYGYAIFGSVLAPVFIIANISIAMMTESVARRARGLETRFLFVYLLTRFVSFPFNATPLLISFYSIQLFTVGLVIFVATQFKDLDSPYRKVAPLFNRVVAASRPRSSSKGLS